MKSLLFTGAFGLISVISGAAFGETLHGALTAAYANNPTLNAARAGQRVQNESVGLAKAGRRPTINGTGQIGAQTTRTFNSVGFAAGGNNDFAQGNVGFNLSQNIFNGFQVANNIRSAKSEVKAGLQVLRNTEQDILTAVVAAYVDVLRDREILNLQSRDVKFSREQVRASRAQAEVGEGTRTDVALAEADLASSLSALAGTKANLKASEASYRQIVGTQPRGLTVPTDTTLHLPKSLRAALRVAQSEHPLILASLHNVDAGQFNVKVSEGTLLPSATLNGNLQRSFQAGTLDSNTDVGTVTFDFTVPIYQGGSRFSSIRQAKETVGQLRIQVDATRRQIEQGVRASWSALVSARSQIKSARTNVRSSRVAVQGLIEERKVGQATTLDVLTAQSNLIAAQIQLANAKRDRIVASYALLSSVGRFAGERISLTRSVNLEQPAIHYKKVTDRWAGLRTPSGG